MNKMRYRKRWSTASFLMGLASAIPAWGAEEGAAPAVPELERLRQEIETLRQRDNDQVRAINILLERIKKIEHGAAAPIPAPSPTPPPTTAPSTPPPAQSPAPRQAAKSAPPEKRADPEPGWYHRRLTLESGISYSRFDRQQLALQGFLALDAIFLGRLSVDEVESDSLTWDVSARYGITDRLQVDLNVPYLYRQTLYRSGGAKASAIAVQEETVSSDLELGDASVGLQYTLAKESPKWPGVSMSLRVKAPTGSHPYGVDITDVEGSEGNLSVPKELPTGSGVWSASAGFSLLRTVDPAVLFFNLSGTYNQPKHFSDIDSKPEARSPGDVKMGDALQYVFGIGYALNERLSITLSYSQQFKRKSATRQDQGKWNDIVSSQSNASTFSNSVTYALSRNWSMVSNVGVGLTEDAPDVSFGLKFAYSF